MNPGGGQAAQAPLQGLVQMTSRPQGIVACLNLQAAEDALECKRLGWSQGKAGAGWGRGAPSLSLAARVLVIYLHLSECCFWQVSREERKAARQKQLSGHYRAQQQGAGV